MSGVLYVVATPIGNLADITIRALEVLKSCDRILAEDTRRTRALLTHFGVTSKAVDALHAHSTPRDLERALSHLKNGENVAIVSDAGTPLVNDPGESLVRMAIANGVTVVPIPGASAVLAALVASGADLRHGFRFIGFMPRDGAERRERIAEVAGAKEVVVMFESPQRIAQTLRDLAEATPHRGGSVARELTKVHEEFLRLPLAELAAVEREWMGEIVVVLDAYEPAAREEEIDDALLDARIDKELFAGGHAKSIAQKLAAWSGRSAREVYARVLDRKGR